MDLGKQSESCSTKLTEEKPFRCTVCAKSFSKKAYLNRHAIAHSTERLHECKLCRKMFKSRKNLATHAGVHSEERPYNCKKCNNTYKWKSSLGEHMRQHSENVCHRCEVCAIVFMTKKALTHHGKVHSDYRPYKCEQCGISFKRLPCLGRHKKVHHIKSRASNSFELCGKNHKHKNSLIFHQKDHVSEQPSEHCEESNEVTFAPNSSQAAPNSHPCLLCGLFFTEEASLSRHLMTHTNHASLTENESRYANSDSAGTSVNQHRNLLNLPNLTMHGIHHPGPPCEEDNSDGKPEHGNVLKRDSNVIGRQITGGKPLIKQNTATQTEYASRDNPVYSVQKHTVAHVGESTSRALVSYDESFPFDLSFLRNGMYHDSSAAQHCTQKVVDREPTDPGRISPQVPSELLEEVGLHVDEMVRGMEERQHHLFVDPYNINHENYYPHRQPNHHHPQQNTNT